MTTLRSALHTGWSLWLLRGLIWLTALSLVWLQVSPVYAADHAVLRDNARQVAWQQASLRQRELRGNLPQTLALQKKIKAQQVAAASQPQPDVRPLTTQEMQQAHGRGPYRNPYLAGAPMPWQRSLRDVNVCTGNLFKSFTDIQVAPGRGAGLVLQRTYNSNEARIGPFGVGWTHAYDIRIQEADSVKADSGNPAPLAAIKFSLVSEMDGTLIQNADKTPDFVPRTDFFGSKHVYHRDADGLYSSPSYMFDEMNSNYDTSLVNGPTKVMDDSEKGEDGTIKHYVNVVTLADGTEGNERACDYIQDRHGNKTTLTYGLSYVQPDGSTRKLLTQVTDPSGRSLVFTWTNLAGSSQPAYRITQVQGPTYRAVYTYYTNASSANAANELYNLRSVALDPDGLNRITTYTYTQATDAYTGSYPQYTQGSTEYGLLNSATDPLGNAVSYSYIANSGQASPFSIGVVSEPGGVDTNGTPRTHTWTFGPNAPYAPTGAGPGEKIVASSEGASLYLVITTDDHYRVVEFDPRDELINVGEERDLVYDNANNVQSSTYHVIAPQQSTYGHTDFCTYGAHGNMLTHQVCKSAGNDAFPGTDTTVWYNADQYFQKASVTDMNGHTTAMGVGTSADANLGNKGSVLWVQDAGYSDPASPSYHKQFTYTYNQYGQKLSETNLNGVVTQYTYGDQWGNLTQVVQDPGSGHLNRTTTMTYDVMGRVLQSTDPSGQTTTFTYNSLGQPLTVATPAKTGSPAETITYIYDTNGRTHSVQDNRGTTTMAYEAACDRVHSVTDPVTGTTAYTYNLFGSRLSVTLPGGGTWTYNYLTTQPTGNGQSAQDEYPVTPDDNPEHMAQHLASITDDQGRRVEYNFADDGHLFSRRFSGIGTSLTLETDYTYDSVPYGNGNSNSHGWLSQIKTTLSGNVASGNSYYYYNRLLSQNDYTYDTAGQRLSNKSSTQPLNAQGKPQTDASGNPVLTTRTEKYQKSDGSSGYDALNRLTNVDYGDGQTQSYSFDAMGNRLSRVDSAAGTTTSAYNAANMLLSTGGYGASGFSNDADGNTLSGNGRTNTWDSQNRLVSCILNGTTSTYKYGADGLRRQSTKNGVSTDFAYNGTMMVREGRASGGSLTSSTVTATYLIGARGPEYRRDDTTGAVRWYVYDGLGSVVGEVDPLGNLTSSPKYDVYGAVRANGGTASSKQGFVGGLGHVSDTETGLIYMRARYMDPQTGRFISQDPSKKQFNWFIYCNDEPINHADPTGKDGELMGTIMSGDISATLDGIGSDFAVDLEGEVVNGARDGSTGQLNDWAQFFVKQLEDQEGAGSGDWGYRTKRIADGSGNFLKAWVRYNDELQVYDMYLNADEGACFDHAVPYAGTM